MISTGNEVIHGLHCYKFENVRMNSSRINSYKLWVTYENNSDNPIPVRYEMRAYNTLFNSHYSHYFMDYDQYTAGGEFSEIFNMINGEYIYIYTKFPAQSRY